MSRHRTINMKKKGEKQVKRERLAPDKLPKTPEDLTEKQKAFCRAYVVDWNGTRAALKAGYSENGAGVIACNLLKNLNIKTYIDSIKNNIEEITGITRQRVAQEYANLAFSSLAHYHKTWIDKKEFDELTEQQKAAIESIEYRTHKYTDYSNDEDGQEVEVEQVKIKLFDKVRALEAISRMLGYDAPQRVQAEVVGALVIQTVDNKNNVELMNEVVKMLKDAEK